MLFRMRSRPSGVRATCRHGLSRAHHYFKAKVPVRVLQALARHQGPDTASRYLAAGRAKQQWMDLQALPTFQDRFRYARELLFPPASYMHGRFGAERVRWLPWLYARRMARGLIKRMRALHSRS